MENDIPIADVLYFYPPTVPDRDCFATGRRGPRPIHPSPVAGIAVAAPVANIAGAAADIAALVDAAADTAVVAAVEKDKTIADIVVGAKAPSEAWKILNSMVEDDNSDRAREMAKRQFEELSMNDDESMKEYIARAKSLALNIKYHNVEVTDQEISRRVLNGLPPSYAPEKTNSAADLFTVTSTL